MAAHTQVSFFSSLNVLNMLNFHVFGVNREVLILIKMGLVIGFCVMAILHYRKRQKGKCTLIPVLFGAFVAILITLLILDFTQQYIAGYFIMIFAANFINFIGFMLILRNFPGKAGRMLQEKTKCYFYVMCSLYLVVFLMSFVPAFRPKCTSEKIYPTVMNLSCCLFIINYIFHIYLNC